jgi:hypothetical protein
MTPQRSAFAQRVAAIAVTTLALLAVVAPASSTPSGTAPAPGPGRTIAAATPTSTTPPAVETTLAISLVASSPTVPTGGTFGYTAEVRLAQRASYLQTVLEVFRPSGQLLFKRTRIANDVKRGTRRYSFERGLTDVLALEPGSYPVRVTVSASVGGATITTETAGTLRVYERDGPRVKLALVARVSGQPMSGPDGRFVVDPAASTGARNAVASISRRILVDPEARVTVAVPPLLLTEWRRISGGYTLADGTTVRPDEAVPLAYNSTLADLKAAIETNRLELVTLGYSDPNLTDLANHGLAKDVGPQYDAGISAVFQSLELTPSVGTVPAGGFVPPNAVGFLSEKNVRYVVVDAGGVRQGKRLPDSGVYKVADENLHALVTETTSSASLGSGDPTRALERSFSHLTRAPKMPLVMRVDIDGDSLTTTDSVGAALSVFEAQPWLDLVTARSLKPAAGASKVRLLAGKSTPDAPKGFWKKVAKSRSYAAAYLAAIGPANPDASTADQQSLVAESSAWAGPNGAWTGARRGLEFAETSLAKTAPVLDAISMKAQPVTLPGATGDVPITIVNDSENTLAVLVTVSSSGGLHVSGKTVIETTLPPQETYLEIPVDMRTALSGKLTVEVSAGGLVLERETVSVSTSYLDRLALGGAVVVALLGMLVFIVRRTRASEAPNGVSDRRARYTDDEDSDARPSSR